MFLKSINIFLFFSALYLSASCANILSKSSSDNNTVPVTIKHSFELALEKPSHLFIMFQAIICENLNILQYLIDHGADVNMHVPKVLWTPLHAAASKNKLKALKFLLNNAADVYAKDADGETPLHYAASKEVRDILIQASENV